MPTLLGFDYGTSKIGVAVGQTITRAASPLVTLRAVQQRPDWDRIAALIDEWRPDALVVGLPYNMDDTEADPAPRARRFARQLEGRFRLPVHLADERLTTREARTQSSRPPVSRSGRVQALDAMAAALILETWLCEQPADPSD